ncbi:MAG: DegT/DnrJ/EryC1/StrS family aminotransferase [Armatimonadetes bacterium]|nr:DegT/DnrJ/EryC1/StrS family aminotransferase [Armatimonadota bacterium]MDE2206096.1 DegT/DnrJ/EryC1/StrS family aminotransferase [Armatimonadota bacterium]
MKVPFADLHAQYLELKEEIDTAIVSVIESAVFSGGPVVAQLEERIAADCGAQYGVAVASGTDALMLSLKACGIQPGDEVITTPFSFGATSEAIALLGATPVFVDIDGCSFNLNPEGIESAITSRTRALLPVDLYGQMADRSAFAAISERHGLRWVNDSAQAVGALQHGAPIAALGHATVLSFYCSKNLGAYGDGGMVLTSDPELAALLVSLRGHGTEHHKYHYERIGYCSRLDALQAAVLLAKLPRLQTWNDLRRRNAELYARLLSEFAAEFGIVLPREEPGNHHVFHQYTIQHPQREALREYLKQRGVATEIYYPWPLHQMPAYAGFNRAGAEFPAAERAARQVLSLPVHPELTEDQIAYVARCIREFHSRGAL